jgi:DNA-binding transcriptional LysR family regulator
MEQKMHPNDRIGRQIKLQNLHVFMTVAETGSMSGAAKRLNTVQPAVSRSVAELERAFGVRLLDRHRQGITPTEYGRALLDCSTAAFDDLHRGVREIETLADPDAGEVRIGCSPPLAANYVPTIVDRISRRKPRVVMELVIGYTDALHRELRERKIDLWIARAFGDVRDARLNYESLFDDPCVVVAGSRSPWSRRRKIALADLAGEQWTLPPLGSMIGSHVAEASCERPRVSPRGSNHALTRSEIQAARDWALPHDDDGLRPAVSGSESGIQGSSNRIASPGCAGLHRDSQASCTQSNRTAFHSAGSRGGQTIGRSNHLGERSFCAQGGTIADDSSVSIFVTDMSKKRRWTRPGPNSSVTISRRATVGVADLGGGALIEVVVTALKG